MLYIILKDKYRVIIKVSVSYTDVTYSIVVSYNTPYEL
jgi:hypothetical protein